MRPPPFLPLFHLGVLFGSALSAVAPDSPRLPATRPVASRSADPFLIQIDNQTWVIGNDVWNVTQKRTYGVKLMYGDRDLVGSAVGHYVSYSMPS